MSSTDNTKSKLEQIPNSVSGDGRSFVAQLKRFLKGFRDDTEEKIDGIGAGAVEQVFDLQLTETHTYDSHGNPINNIFVEFDNTNVSDYLNAEIWMKKSTENAYQLVGTTSNVTYTIPDVLTGATYYVKVVACNTHAGSSDFDDAPVEYITIQGTVLVPQAPTQFYLTFDEEGPLWEWKFIDNGYIDFFELRMDGHAGVWDNNRLDSTKNDYSRVPPPVRSGTAYLFIRNVYGMYSQPATHTFNIVAPAKPTAPTLEFTLDGAVVTMAPLPTGCTHYLVEITDFENQVETFETKNSQFTYFQFSGTIKARYAFVDSNGQGAWSDLVTGNISDGNVTSGRLADGAVVESKIYANAVTTAKIAANAITSDKLEAREVDTHGTVIKEGAVATKNIRSEAITTEKIQAGAIITDLLAANAVTTAKIYSGNVSALRIQADNIASGAIKTDKLDAGSVTTAKLDTGAVTTAKLDAGAVTAAKIYSGEVQTNLIQANNIATGAITTAKLDAGAVTAAKIYSGEVQTNLIQTNNIAAGAITSAKIYSGEVDSDKIQANQIHAASLSAICATIGLLRTKDGTGEDKSRLEIESNQIRVYDTQGNLRVRLGIWS